MLLKDEGNFRKHVKDASQMHNNLLLFSQNIDTRHRVLNIVLKTVR